MARTPKAAPSKVAPVGKRSRKAEEKIAVPQGFEDVTSSFDKLPAWDTATMPVLNATVTRVADTQITDSKGTRDTQVAHVVTDDGEELALWHAAALDDLFKVMVKGSKIQVHYQGKRDLSRGRTLKMFRSFHRAP